MIRVALVFAPEGRLRRIESLGHAPYPVIMELVSRRANLYNAVCAALSALEYTLVHSVRELTDAACEPSFGKGNFTLQVDSPGARPERLETLLSSFVIGLKLLEARHGDVLSIQTRT